MIKLAGTWGCRLEARVVGFAFFIVVVALQPCLAIDPLYVRSTPYVDVLTEDPESLGWLLEVTDVTLEEFGNIFPVPLAFVPPLRIEANPGITLEDGEMTRLVTGRTYSTLRLELKWDASLAYQSFNHAFIEAFLVRLARNQGIKPARGPAPWLISALSYEVGETLYPGLVNETLVGVKNTTRVPVFNLLTASTRDLTSGDGAFFSWLLFQFIRSLKEMEPNRALIFQLALSGELTPEALLENAGIAAGEAGLLELRWNTWVESELDRLHGMIYDLDRSRLLLRSALTFGLSSDNSPSDLPDLESIETLWNLRNHSTTLSFIEQRLRQVKLELPRVNPIYFNALHSSGLVLESILMGDLKDFEEAQKRLADDTDRAINLHDEIDARLTLSSESPTL